jgi:hypothetical protein
VQQMSGLRRLPWFGWPGRQLGSELSRADPSSGSGEFGRDKSTIGANGVLIARGQGFMGTFPAAPSEALAEAVIGDANFAAGLADSMYRRENLVVACFHPYVKSVEDRLHGGDWTRIDDAVRVGWGLLGLRGKSRRNTGRAGMGARTG